MAFCATTRAMIPGSRIRGAKTVGSYATVDGVEVIAVVHASVEWQRSVLVGHHDLEYTIVDVTSLHKQLCLQLVTRNPHINQT